MKFLYPQFLYALFALIIPVIIHLFNFQRYKKVYFSNVSFLKEVKHSSQAKSNLKHILILLSRMFAIAACVFAFAQPFIPVSNTQQNRTSIGSSIYVDNSFSSENRTAKGNLMDIERELAQQLSQQLPTNLNHQLLTNEFSSNQQHLYPVTELSKKITNVQTNPNSQTLEKIIKRQSTAFDAANYTSYIISDFQKSQFNFEQISSDSLTQYVFIPVSPLSTQNISIDSIWFENPIHRINEEDEIFFRVTNHGNEDLKSLSVNLNLDGLQKGIAVFDLPANSILDTLLSFSSQTSGWHEGFLSIDDFPVVFDNTFYFNFHIKKQINILEITTRPDNTDLAKAFATETYFNFETEIYAKMDLGKLKNTDLLILSEVENYSSGFISSIKNYVGKGGHLAIIPANKQNSGELNTLMSQLNIPPLGSIKQDSIRINFIDTENALYKGVFAKTNAKINLPQIYQSYSYPRNSISTPLLTTANGQSILSKWDENKGSVYVFNISLDPQFSNFSKHSIFLPTFFQMAFNSTGTQSVYHTIGINEIVPIQTQLADNELIFHIKNEELGIDLIPEVLPSNAGITLSLHSGIKDAGNYTVTQGDSLIGLLAFNFQGIESDLDYHSGTDLTHIIDSLGLSNFTVFETELNNFKTDFEKRNKGIELWRWFIIFTLLFLAIEVVLIRFFKPSVL